MPGNQDIKFFSANAPGAVAGKVTDSDALVAIRCPHDRCGRDVSAPLIAKTRTAQTEVQWLRCPACGLGSVVNGDVLQPTAVAGETVEGLPQDTESAFGEARAAMGVGAFTAGELMCRKILMHVAADKGAPTNRSFAEYINHLEQTGFITPPMKPWVDQIRRNGNESTHELPPADRERALGTLAFTTQMLRLIYEMPHKVAQYLPGTA